MLSFHSASVLYRTILRVGTRKFGKIGVLVNLSFKKIKVLQFAQLLALVIIVSVSLMRLEIKFKTQNPNLWTHRLRLNILGLCEILSTFFHSPTHHRNIENSAWIQSTWKEYKKNLRTIKDWLKTVHICEDPTM